MKDAMAAVRNGQITVLQAAAVYNVPKSTLHDRVKGKVKHQDTVRLAQTILVFHRRKGTS